MANRTVLLTMSPQALKRRCLEFYLAGFRASGYDYHGERINVDTLPAVKRNLSTYFKKLWSERR